MATTNSALVVKTRAKTGTTAAIAVRKAGSVPGTLYGHGKAPLSIEVDARAFDELLHRGGKNQLLEIALDDGAKDTALIRDVQRDPISRRVIHADLQRVSATEEISASLPMVFVGTPDGVRNFGGVMDVIVRTLDVIGPANALPESIEVVVDQLGIHEHLSAGEVTLPEGIALDMDPGTVLVSVEPSRTESEAEVAPVVAEGVEVPTVAESESGSETETA
jgi:large subunit ribosomal protein L25